MIIDIKNAVFYYILSSNFTEREKARRPAAHFYIEIVMFHALAMNL